MNPIDVLTIEQKADIVAKDLIAAAEPSQSNLYYNKRPHIEFYQPSKKLLEIMSEYEVVSTLNYLKNLYCISYELKQSNLGGSDAYGVYVHLDEIRGMMRQHEATRMLDTASLMPITSHTGITFDKVRSTLTVNGTEVLLGKSHGDKSFQYWICYHTMKNPNKAIAEIKILDSYSKDFGERARSRAIRDAVIGLNNKLKLKAHQDKKLFLYSKGKVIYVEDNTGTSRG